jgi:hypothetical protein
MEDYSEFDDYLLMESTGVSPIDDDNIYVPCPDFYDQYHHVEVPKAVHLEPATVLQGAGINNSSTAVEEKVEELSQSEKAALKDNITKTEKASTDGRLQVETFQTGKRKLDAKVKSALAEEGYGKKKPKKSDHSLKLI